jgi:predicted 3-demethylubiquinone-9 3-methyltransferase (glyoxalase superfamily)
VEFEVFAYCDADSGEAFDLSKEAHKSGARDDIWLRMQGPLQHDSPPDAPKGSIELRFRVTAGSAEEAMERVGELAERAGVKVESEDLVARTVSDGRARREMASPNEAITVEVRKFLQAVIEGLPDNLTHEQSEIKPFTRRGELYAWGEGTDTSDFPFEWTVSAFVMTDGGRPIVKIMAWAKSSMMQSDATREWSVNFNEDLDEFVEVVVGWIKDTAGYRRESRRVEWKYEPGDWASMMTKLRRDAFVRGYVRALMFVNPHNEEMTLSDVAIEELEKAVEDAEAFRKANADLLDDAYAVEGYDEEQAGHDLALTRNFHGAGFWDSGLGKIGDDLTAAAEKLGDFNFSDASTRESRRRRLERAGVSSVPSSVVRVDADGFVEKLGSLDYGDLGCSEEDFIALLSAAEVVASEGEEVSKFDLYRAASDLGHGVSAAADAAWDAIVGESRGRGRRRAEGEEAMPSGYERYWDIIDMVENHGVTWDALFDEMMSAMSNRQAWEHFSHARSMLGIPEFDPEKYDAEHHSGMTPHDWVRR